MMNVKDQAKDEPIALEAYEALTERYAALADSKAENAYVERLAMFSLLPEVEGRVSEKSHHAPRWPGACSSSGSSPHR